MSRKSKYTAELIGRMVGKSEEGVRSYFRRHKLKVANLHHVHQYFNRFPPKDVQTEEEKENHGED